MSEKYTIETVMKTGETSQTFGSEYYVKFAENEGTYKLWFKKDPTAGQQIEGTINGSKFAKAKKAYTPPAAKPAAKSYSRKDNSDGQRQGMCLNNAANYVNEHSHELVAADLWAKTVWTYANALYLLGDLGVQKETEATTMTELVSGN